MQTAQEMEKTVLDKASEDADFRARLLSNPKDAIQQAVGVTVPDGFTIKVHEADSTTAHLVLPSNSKLSSADLSAVGGGTHVYGTDIGGHWV